MQDRDVVCHNKKCFFTGLDHIGKSITGIGVRDAFDQKQGIEQIDIRREFLPASGMAAKRAGLTVDMILSRTSPS